MNLAVAMARSARLPVLQCWLALPTAIAAFGHGLILYYRRRMVHISARPFSRINEISTLSINSQVPFCIRSLMTSCILDIVSICFLGSPSIMVQLRENTINPPNRKNRKSSNQSKQINKIYKYINKTLGPVTSSSLKAASDICSFHPLFVFTAKRYAETESIFVCPTLWIHHTAI